MNADTQQAPTRTPYRPGRQDVSRAHRLPARPNFTKTSHRSMRTIRGSRLGGQRPGRAGLGHGNARFSARNHPNGPAGKAHEIKHPGARVLCRKTQRDQEVFDSDGPGGMNGTGNFEQQGRYFGPIQVNLGIGSLQKLYMRLRARKEDLLRQCYDNESHDQKYQQTLDGPRTRAVAWAKKCNIRSKSKASPALEQLPVSGGQPASLPSGNAPPSLQQLWPPRLGSPGLPMWPLRPTHHQSALPARAVRHVRAARQRHLGRASRFANS
jgi:hypothetical protein